MLHNTHQSASCKSALVLLRSERTVGSKGVKPLILPHFNRASISLVGWTEATDGGESCGGGGGGGYGWRRKRSVCVNIK